MGLIVRNVNFGGRLRGTFPQVPPPPPPPPSDVYGAYTVLDLPGTGTNNSNNNVFLDSSSNAFSITRVGNTTQGSFSPFSTAPGYWSNYFDGSGDSLSLSNNIAFDFGTGNFTIEFWMNPVNTTANGGIIIDTRLTGGWVIHTNPENAMRLSIGLGGSDGITSANTFNSRQWNHIALVRSGNTFRFYINGVSTNSSTLTNSMIANTVSIGIKSLSGSGVDPFNGYISNLRMVKGTALYTTNFTPPTTPLTAVSGTSLLTCQSNRFIDNSSNAFAITRNGDTTVSAFGPFNPASSYNTATMGGSMYFDGNGDYLTAPTNNSFTFGSGNFTVEAWIYPTASGMNMFIATEHEYETLASIYLYVNSSNRLEGRGYVNNVASVIISDSNVLTNAWSHVVLARNNNTLILALNGVIKTTSISGSIDNPSQPFNIGRQTNNSWFFNGYISNLRVVKGTAVYTSNFTPPTAPVSAISGTSLLLNGTNAAIYDASTKNNLETLGNAVVSTTVSASGSMYFDGSGDYLMLPPAQRNLYLTGAFTWETWLYQTTSSSMTIYGNFAAAWGDNDRWSFVSSPLGTFSNSLKLFWYRGTYGYNQCAIGSTTGLTLNTWNHIAIVRDASNNIYIFLNGQQLTLTTYNENITWSNSVSLTNPAPISINGGPDYATGNGYINNMRMTQGIARYTANFTPPSRS